MTIRDVLSIGHPALRAAAQPVADAQIATAEIQELIDDLIDTMRAANGAGLAANQIGVHHRVVVLEVDANPRYPYKPKIPLTVAVNPIFEVLDDEVFQNNEGCLSVPLRGDVTRAMNLKVTYKDRHGDEHCQTVRGLTAGTWQHETDHLDGVLFIDRVTDPATLSTWEEFEAHHRDAFVERIQALTEEGTR
ncbi:MAG: peptide deformylase [Acidimicrobiales bacterium]